MAEQQPPRTDGALENNNPYERPSFSVGNRLLRAVWGVVHLLLFRPSPRPLHRWRAFLLRLFGAQLGRHVHIYPSVKVWAPWNLVCEDHVGVGDGVTLYSMARIHIGHHAVVSQGAHLCTGTHDIHSTNFQLRSRPININPHVWVCAEVFVGPGVSVARGCVIGARSVLFKSVDAEWTVWAGNAAVQIGTRHNNIQLPTPACPVSGNATSRVES